MYHSFPSFPRDFCDVKFRLGQEIDSRWGKLRFIKVTTKGFNFLIVDRNRTLCPKRHFYARKYSNKDIPYGINEFSIKIPIRLYENFK